MSTIENAGQAGIRFREALVAGDAEAMTRELPHLDEAHHVELVLGEALRDARDGFAAARRYMLGEDVCALLLGTPDRRYDRLAASYVAGRRAPDRWVPLGAPLDRPVKDDIDVANALMEGIAGDALLDAFQHLPLYPAVSHYYRAGSIHALGCRPLLTLAATAGPEPG